MILGDFNHGTINWATSEAEARDKDFLDTMQDCYLTQHIRGDNILDLVFSSEQKLVDYVCILPPLANSDHNAISFKIAISSTVTITAEDKVQDLNRADWEGIRNDLTGIKWRETLTDGSNVQENLETFTGILHDKCQHIPRKSKKRRNRCLWMTKKAKQATSHKAKRWRQYRTTGAAVDHDHYVKALNTATKIVKEAKRAFELKLAKNIKTDAKSFFSYARSKQRTKETISPLINDNGEAVEEPKEQANILNDFFSSVFTIEDKTSLPDIDHREEDMPAIDIQSDDMMSRLQKLRADKAPGPDCIHPRMLKELAEYLATPIATILQQSLDESEVPDDWREANVVPLFKKGSKRDPANYRPISLTSQLGKVMESIIRDRILEHIETPPNPPKPAWLPIWTIVPVEPPGVS